VKDTVPVGCEGLAVVSVTVTVQVEGEPAAANADGEHATDVEVAWSTTLRVCALLLVLCVASPP
jgi:hypothetical protein